MKKISSILLMTVVLFGLTACSKTQKKETTSSSKPSNSQHSSPSSTSTSESQNSQTSTQQSSTEERSSETPPSTSSSKSIHTKEGSESDLGKARLTLYQEGIDSSSISDEKLIELYNKADGDKENFIALVKGMME